MKVPRTTIDQVFDISWQIGSSSQISREHANLLLAGNLACEEEPEQTWVVQV